MSRRFVLPLLLLAAISQAACDEGHQSAAAGDHHAPAGKQMTTEAGEVSFSPVEGYVPDAETAIKIAVAVWEPIYGANEVAGEKPYQASLKDGVWTVEGSLPKNYDGGVASAKIAKSDGRILMVIHGK